MTGIYRIQLCEYWLEYWLCSTQHVTVTLTQNLCCTHVTKWHCQWIHEKKFPIFTHIIYWIVFDSCFFFSFKFTWNHAWNYNYKHNDNVGVRLMLRKFFIFSKCSVWCEEAAWILYSAYSTIRVCLKLLAGGEFVFGRLYRHVFVYWRMCNGFDNICRRN